MAENKNKRSAQKGGSANNKKPGTQRADKSSNKPKKGSQNTKRENKTGDKSGVRTKLPVKEGMRKELLMLIMAGTAVLLYVFLILGGSDGAGIVGKAVSGFLLGLMGVGAWILPTALVIGVIYLAVEDDRLIFKIRAVFSGVLFCAILAFVDGFGDTNLYEMATGGEFVSAAYTGGSVSNGGLLGAALFLGLYKLVGIAGAYIILTLICIILLMFISGGSLVGFIRRVRSFGVYIRERFVDYYYDDGYDYDYYEGEEYEGVSEPSPTPEPKERVVQREKPPGEKMREPKADYPAPHDKKGRIIAVDIKKGERESNPISVIAVDKGDTVKKGPVKDEDDRERLARLDEIFNRGRGVKEDYLHPEPEENIPQTVQEPLQEPRQEPVADPEEAGPIPLKEPDYEDLPPWDTGKEPEIVKAEKTKLVDKLETDKVKTAYKFPKLSFLGVNKDASAEKNREEILAKSRLLEDTLAIFKVEAKVEHISIGPTVTRYELTPSKGTKVSAVTNLENDIKFAMAAESIIIEAPIPGKSAIGIEIPNDTRESVYFSEVLRSEQFQKFKSKIAFGLGKDITGSVTVADLAKMPHLLVAGTTGSGKSVCINTLIMSILYKATPDEVKMIMVDPKMVELSVYNDIPHLLLPVVTEPEKAAGALNWAVIEMERRYKLLATTGTRNLEGYNQKVSEEERLSQIVIIIDELADLMMVVGKEIETSICRLAQKARAAGMHLVLATQRPSADVLTGLIRSNVPSRIAFKVSGSMDSRIILDSTGAEKLLGKGDMLFKTADMPKPMRIQGAFVTDDEVERVVNYIKMEEPVYDEAIINEINNAGSAVSGETADGEDPLTEDVLTWIVNNPKCASAGKVQRNFRIGFNRASRIIEDLEARGILGPPKGSQPREVLMDKYELRERRERQDSYYDY